MLTLYDYLPSQNAYKVRLLLSHLELPYQTKIISIFEGEGTSHDYRAINPTGAVPAIRLADGRTIAESNAILFYLAKGTAYLADEPYQQARIVQWLSFEADYVQSTVATLRHWKMTGKDKNYPSQLVAMKHNGAVKTLSVLDHALAKTPYLTGDTYTIADMSVFAYVHRAEEAGLALAEFPRVGQWINRIKAQPGFLDTVYPYSIDPHSAKELP